MLYEIIRRPCVSRTPVRIRRGRPVVRAVGRQRHIGTLRRTDPSSNTGYSALARVDDRDGNIMRAVGD